jgi:hypothetical protein
VDLQIYVKKDTKYFHSLSNKFKSQNLQNVCCFQVSRKPPKHRGLSTKCCLSSSSRRQAPMWRLPGRRAPPLALKARPDDRAMRMPSTPSLAPAHPLALTRPLSSFPGAHQNPSHGRRLASPFPASPSEAKMSRRSMCLYLNSHPRNRPESLRIDAIVVIFLRSGPSSAAPDSPPSDLPRRFRAQHRVQGEHPPLRPGPASLRRPYSGAGAGWPATSAWSGARPAQHEANVAWACLADVAAEVASGPFVSHFG